MTAKIDRSRYVPALMTSISLAYRAGQGATFRRMFDLGFLEWRILLILSTDPQIPGHRVAKILGADTAAVSRSVKLLQEAGFISAVRDHSHPRRQLLSLTEAGIELYEQMEKIAIAREEYLLDVLTEAEREMLISILQRLLARVPLASEWSPDNQVEQ